MTDSLYGEILRRIPREPPMKMHPLLTSLAVEEANAVQWANAYYNQLKNPLQQVVPVDSEQSIESLCQEIQKLVHGVDPKNPTEYFTQIYGKDPNMCRAHNYFNQKIEEMRMKDPGLTRQKFIPPEKGTLDMDVAGLDKLALSIFHKETNTDPLDQLVLDIFEKESNTEELDKLALALYSNKS